MSDMGNGMQKTGPLGGEARRYGDSHWEGEAERAKGYELSGKIMLSAIVILFVVIVLMAGLHLYARWYLLRARRRHLRRRRRRRTNLVFYVDPNNPSAAPVSSRGLDPAVLKSLPVFSYSPKEEGEEEEEGALECAVCLSEFEEHEKGRRLPKCNHCFHIECIDMWFHSHSTCPLCRSPVVDHDTPVRIFENPTPHTPQPQQQQEVVITVTEPGSSSGLGSSDHQEGGGFRTASLKARRRAVELVGVSIEVPRRNTSFGRSEEGFGSPSFKSPGGRMRSLRRILSRDIRAALSPSPSSAPGWSGSVTHELDLERAQTPRPRASERVSDAHGTSHESVEC